MAEITFTPTTYEDQLMETHPHAAIRSLPDWYKDIPPYTDGENKLQFPLHFAVPNLTVKRCVPFLDAFNTGYVAVLSDDVFVQQIDGLPIVRWRSNANLVTDHPTSQVPGVPIPKEYSPTPLKWENKWTVNVPKGYSVMFTHPLNRFDLPFYTLTGIVDCDFFDAPVNFPFLLKKDFEGIIERGTPICQLIPIKRDNWESTVKTFDADQSYKSIRSSNMSMINHYKKGFWKKKSYK